MATSELYVVIGALVAQLAVLYLPFSNKKKAIYSLVVFAALLLGLRLVGENDGGTKNHLPCNYREIIARNPYAKQTLMAAYNMTEAEIDAKQPFEEGTPIERSVNLLAVMALYLTPLFIWAAICDKANDDEIKKVHQWTFALCTVAAASLLSLYYGLELTVMPLYKKAFRKAKPSPALS
jgi:hypothetical protein